MINQKFIEYTKDVYNKKSGTFDSYIRAIRILDEIFTQEDVFGLNGLSISEIDDFDLVLRIEDFVRQQEELYRQDEQNSIFRFVNPKQTSYPRKRFCTGAMAHLVRYYEQQMYNQANTIVTKSHSGLSTSKKLIGMFKINLVGTDRVVEARTRVGQDYFRKMVLANYENKCCVTGLNVPQTLRASHIVAWADDKANRMNPENGLCLSATYDAAFDKHLISFDDDYRMIISKEIKEYYTNETTKEYFENFEGKQIILPERFLPSKQLLAKHRELIVG